MTKAELQRELAKAKGTIADLEQEVKTLEWVEDELERRGDADDVGERFAALCAALDERVPLHQLPVGLRLDFEALAERLGVGLPLGRVP